MADKVTVISPRDPCPFSTVAVEDLEALVADGLLRPLSGGPQQEWMAPASKADPTPPLGYVVSFSPFHEWGLECQRATSCGRSCTTTGWSYITSTPTLSRQFARVFWGLTLTGTCEPISSPRSSSP
jgi:hypothetical protein